MCQRVSVGLFYKDLKMTIIVDGVSGLTLPTWTTATRPSPPTVGQMGYNSTTSAIDQYVASGWVTSLSGIVGIANGGTNATTASITAIRTACVGRDWN